MSSECEQLNKGDDERVHSLRISHDPISLLHDAGNKWERFKLISYFVFHSFCSKSGPNFLLDHDNESFSVLL